MPKKKCDAEGGGDAVSDSTERMSKADQIKVQNAVMLWLQTPSNRNIVMGSSGNAQNQGGMNSRATVVPKSHGFVMMAKFVDQMCSVKVTSEQAEGKFRYMLGKFTKANSYSKSSNAGCDDSDFAKGIRSMPQKLESMCPQYEVWSTWFGHLQKFNPASVIASSSQGVDEHEGASDADDASQGDLIDRQMQNGDDADIDLQVQDEERENAVASPRSSAAVPDGAAAVPDGDVLGAAPLSRPISSPAASGGGGAIGRGGSAAVRKEQSAHQLANAKQALDNAVACVPGSGTSTPRSGSGSSSFEATYASVKTSICRDQINSQTSISRSQISSQDSIARQKVESQEKIERAKLDAARDIQRREQDFQAQLNAINVLAADQRDKDERRVKQKIEFQNNVTQLLIKDETGELAKKLVAATQENAASFEDVRHDSSLSNLLTSFLGRYAPRDPLSP